MSNRLHHDFLPWLHFMNPPADGTRDHETPRGKMILPCATTDSQPALRTY